MTEEELREKIQETVGYYLSGQFNADTPGGTSYIDLEDACTDSVIQLIKAAETEARIDERENTELPFEGDHSHCLDKRTCVGYQNAASDLYNENLIRIAELRSHQPNTKEKE